jgi:uncharacterized protein (DUF433 family)
MTATSGVNDPRDVPVYSIAEAARYLGISRYTLHSWLYGRYYKTQKGRIMSKPLIEIADPKNKLLSFINLVETYVLASTRQLHGVHMNKIRSAIEYMQTVSPSRHPLASNQFYTDGKELFVKNVEATISASQKGQLGLQLILDAYLNRIDRDRFGYPTKLFPLRVGTKEQTKGIVIDPLVSSGQPVIAGTGVMVSIVCSRHAAGESVRDLAADYGLKPREIEGAIRYFKAA